MHDDSQRIIMVRLHVAAYLCATLDPTWAASTVRTISNDPLLLAQATAPYTKDTANRIER